MGFTEVLILALALAVDAFTVGASVGLKHRAPRQRFRLVFHFGLFQALMPLAGIGAGGLISGVIERWDHWLVFVVLGVVGARMIYSAWTEESAKPFVSDATRGMSLVGLSVAVSVDAFGAGFGLAASGAPIFKSVFLIGIVAGAATLAGMLAGGGIGRRTGRLMESAAGFVLISLGSHFLAIHLGWLS